jgi:hypothetical protein
VECPVVATRHRHFWHGACSGGTDHEWTGCLADHETTCSPRVTRYSHHIDAKARTLTIQLRRVLSIVLPCLASSWVTVTSSVADDGLHSLFRTLELLDSASATRDYSFGTPLPLRLDSPTVLRSGVNATLANKEDLPAPRQGQTTGPRPHVLTCGPEHVPNFVSLACSVAWGRCRRVQLSRNTGCPANSNITMYFYSAATNWHPCIPAY